MHKEGIDRDYRTNHEEKFDITVHESIETTECCNWMPKRKIVNSDLVYSPTQVTEHR